MKFNKFFMAMAAAATMFAACGEKEGPTGGDDWTETAPEFTSDVADIVVTEETLSEKVKFTYR